MQFKVGDQVMHASLGSGQIVAIEEKQLSGRELRLFYVVTVDKSTIWVPVDSVSAPNLRLLVSSEALNHCRALLKGRPTPLNTDRQQRLRDRATHLRLGSFESLCEVIRDLSAYGWPKPLGESDASALRKIQDAVSREWANAAGVLPLQASQEITALLHEGRQIYNG